MNNCEKIILKSYLKRRRIHNFYFVSCWLHDANRQSIQTREFLVSTVTKLLVNTKILTIISIGSWNQRLGYLRSRYCDPQSKAWQIFWDTGTVDLIYPASRAFPFHFTCSIWAWKQKKGSAHKCVELMIVFVSLLTKQKKKKKQAKECFFFLWS